MFRNAWSRTKYSKKRKIDTFSHDIDGNKIYRHGIRPLLIFYSGTDVYFLNCRSVKEYSNKFPGEVKVKFQNSDISSFINTSSIQVMDNAKFFKIYRKNDITDDNKLSYEDTKDIINELNNRLDSDYLTIQRISINEKYKSVNEVLFSTKIENDLPLNENFDKRYLVQTNESVATVLHLRALIKHLKVMDDEELTNYRNAENLDEYMYKNYNGYRSKNDYIKVLNQITEPENKEEVKSKLSL
ncbi:Mbov_0400 family ICE element protein [Mycoplasma sp. HS2188]|uniref:Mbov_0400 family ICE element protein n=1 Tax=Mycoplasma sp. HS2188 TaxID=2976765 RepID=UPI0021A9AF96|nr:hypothetical protein [Mycoplasma sp. HS2188]